MRYRRETVHSAALVCDVCNGLEARGCQIVSIINTASMYNGVSVEGMYEIFYKEPV